MIFDSGAVLAAACGLPNDVSRARQLGEKLDSELIRLRALPPGRDRHLQARAALRLLGQCDHAWHPSGRAGRLWAERLQRQFERLLDPPVRRAKPERPAPKGRPRGGPFDSWAVPWRPRPDWL